MPSSSAEAKALLFRKDRVFTPEQTLWLERFLETARRSGRERLYMQHTREILTHLKVPRDLMQKLGASIPVAGGNSPVVKKLEASQLLQRILRLMYEGKRAFPADDDLVVRLRKLAVFCGATRDDTTRVLHIEPPDF